MLSYVRVSVYDRLLACSLCIPKQKRCEVPLIDVL